MLICIIVIRIYIITLEDVVKRRIAFVSRNPSAYTRRVIQGIIRYVASQNDLQLKIVGQVGFEPLWDVTEFEGDGVIGMFTDVEGATPFLSKGQKVVNVSAATNAVVPWVSIDNNQVGIMAADYFLSCGFRSFGYLTAELYNGLFSIEREDNFRQHAEENGGSFQSHTVSHQFIRSQEGWKNSVAKVRQWIETQPQPLALFCVCDVVARLAVHACEEGGIPVPKQVSVLGVDNDEMLCHSIAPSISSIEQNEERVGYEAAKMLDDLICGRKRDAYVLRLEPLELIARQSTGAQLIEDPHVCKALEIMQNSFFEPIKIQDIVARINLSRCELEKRFKKHLNRTPGQELTRIRIEQAKQLLATTDTSLKEIAYQCGFKRPERFHETFKRVTDQTPLAYRKINR